VEKTECGVRSLFIFPKDSILMRLRVFHFMPPYTCSVFLNLKLCTILGSLVIYSALLSTFYYIIYSINEDNLVPRLGTRL
jgi:hypothetical protein